MTDKHCQHHLRGVGVVIKEEYHLTQRKELGNNIDKLAVMIGKLAARDSRTNRQFKPQTHQFRGRGQNRNYNYNQRNYQDRYRSNNRSNSKNRGQYRQDRSRHRYEQNFGKVILGGTLEIW